MGLTQNLLNLYRVDAQVRGLRARLDSAKRYLDAQTRILGELQQQAEELRSRRRQVQAKAGNFEGEMKGHDERIEKLRTELNAASTNKQYTAVLTELNTIKDARSEVESLALEQLELSEEIGGEIETADEQCAERSKVRSLAEDELRKRGEEVGVARKRRSMVMVPKSSN